MKKQKAFTLVELLGILVVLSLILLISVPAISNTLKNSQQKQFDQFLIDLELATETYIQLNRSQFPELDTLGGQVTVPITDLVGAGLVKKTVEDPKTKQDVPLDYTITVTYLETGLLEYHYDNANLNLNQYAKEGLILWYDGINHGNDSNIWNDLSGNNYHGSCTNITFKDHAGIFNGNDSGIYLGSQLTNLFNGSNTIEIVVSYDDDNARDILIGNFSNTHSVSLERHLSNRGRFWFDSGNVDQYTDNNFYISNKRYAISNVFNKPGNLESIYQSGKKMKEFTSPLFNTFQYPYNDVWIGRDSRVGEANLKGKIYSVRVYNRVLTNEEILKNYQLDQQRYQIK